MEIPERDWMLPNECGDRRRDGFWESRIWNGPVSVYTGDSIRVSNRAGSAAGTHTGACVPWEKMLSAAKAGPSFANLRRQGYAGQEAAEGKRR